VPESSNESGHLTASEPVWATIYVNISLSLDCHLTQVVVCEGTV